MLWMYAGFLVLVGALLALDLGVFNRHAHVIKPKEALGWSALWITLGLAFSAFIYLGYQQHWLGLGLTPDRMTSDPQRVGELVIYNDGWSAFTKYLTGYLVEKSLAVDNIFIIALVFGSFGVPAMYQHRVLFWGIAGALVMRGAMIALGTGLLREFSWIIYVFGGFLVITGVKMVFSRPGEKDPAAGAVVRLFRRLVPVSEQFHGSHFFVRAGSPAAGEAATPDADARRDRVVERARRGALMATPLLLALIVVELMDVLFAVDSIPAIFAVTGDSFLVFTSNVMAMLGLRSLYFALAGMMDRFVYLKYSLAAVLVLIGVKMMAHSWLRALLGRHFTLVMLAVVALVLACGVVASLVATRRRAAAAADLAA